MKIMKLVVGFLALVGAFTIFAWVVGAMEANMIEYERTHNCGGVPETGMYRCNRGR